MKTDSKTIPSIHELPEHVKRMIAAGEVIEGPHSVIKELIENSADSGAGRISVKIEDGGMRRIVVTDDGCGILPEELKLAITEHATSKITSVDDIQSIYSYGFRGEALSSIAAVSHITILSRPHNLDEGAKLVSDDNISVLPFAGPVGTTVIVEHIFYNTPARKKFLKARSTEIRLIRESFIKIAIANPAIVMTLENEDKVLMSLPAREHIRERLADIYGSNEASRLLEGSVQDLKVNINGFISSLEGLKKSRSMQFLFVNGRPVEYKNLSFHVNRAYDSMLPKGLHPVLFLFITIPPDLIDVNVHPCKREIKLFDTRYIDSLIYGFVKKTLGQNEIHLDSSVFTNFKNDNISERELHSNSYENEADHDQSNLWQIADNDLNSKNVSQKNNEGSRISKNDEINGGFNNLGNCEIMNDYTDDPLKTGPSKTVSYFNDGRDIYNQLHNWYYIGTLFKTYLLVEKEESLKIVDFHAAHERIIYDRLIKNEEKPSVQKLIFPEEVNMDIQEVSFVSDNLDVLLSMGFDLDIFSQESLVIRGIPETLDPSQAVTCIREFTQSISDLSLDRNAEDYFIQIKKHAAERVACHSAKRAGDPMSRIDAESLLVKIFSGSYPLRCPHGRPFVADISRKDFEKLFRRLI